MFQTPLSIGGSNAPDATFTTMNINGTLTLTNPIGPKSGGTSMKTYSKGDLIVATDQYSLSTPVGNKDNIFSADSTTSTGSWDSVVFGSTSGHPSGYSKYRSDYKKLTITNIIFHMLMQEMQAIMIIL